MQISQFTACRMIPHMLLNTPPCPSPPSQQAVYIYSLVPAGVTLALPLLYSTVGLGVLGSLVSAAAYLTAKKD